MRILTTLALVAALSGAASADKADKLFQKAKKLHAEKKFAEACPTYEEVDKTDPAIGSKLNAAKCYEDWGRLATAYTWYIQAEKMATDAKDERAPKIKELIEELDVNVPRMTIKIPEGADPDVVDTITLDGRPVPEDWHNTQQRIDPGPHVIEFVVDGQKKKKLAPVERGGESELSLDIPKGVGKKPRKKKGDDQVVVTAPDPGKTRRYIAYGLGGAGVVAIGVASVMTLSARGDYNDALEEHCMGSTSGCNATGVRLTHDARSTANVATVITLIGVAAIAGGAVLYFTAPKAPPTTEKVPPADKPAVQALYVSPTIDSTGGGFVVGGSF
jgi:tetratricopeptide (TPR) repeat protein